MNKKLVIIGWLRRFGMIHGFTMMMVYLIALISKPDAVFDVSFLGNMLLFSLAGTLPGLIYYSNHELSEKEWWIRTIVHFLLLNALLLPISNAIGLWTGVGGIFAFVGLILTVDVLVHVGSFGLDWVVARDINKMLKQRHHQE